MDELCGSCWAGKLCITASGDAYPCVFSRFIKVGNVLTDTVGDLVNGEALRAFRRVSYLGEEGGQG
jgi:radical SAM protein with 4Fe4S-binding SPASM domain